MTALAAIADSLAERLLGCARVDYLPA